MLLTSWYANLDLHLPAFLPEQRLNMNSCSFFRRGGARDFIQCHVNLSTFYFGKKKGEAFHSVLRRNVLNTFSPTTVVKKAQPIPQNKFCEKLNLKYGEQITANLVNQDFTREMHLKAYSQLWMPLLPTLVNQK